MRHPVNRLSCLLGPWVLLAACGAPEPEPEGRPIDLRDNILEQGIIDCTTRQDTGYVNGDAFVVEHVIVCPGAAPTTLRAMLQAGLAEAWRAGHQRVTFMLPEDDERLPDAPALGRLALGLGFLPFATQDGVTWWTRWRP